MKTLAILGLIFAICWAIRNPSGEKRPSRRVDPPVRDASVYRARKRHTSVNEYGEIVDRYR
jgi:hypothetical protein